MERHENIAEVIKKPSRERILAMCYSRGHSVQFKHRGRSSSPHRGRLKVEGVAVRCILDQRCGELNHPRHIGRHVSKQPPTAQPPTAQPPTAQPPTAQPPMEGVDYFIPHLSSTDWMTQMYTAAAIQNMCQNVEFASSLKGRGALQPLRNLLRSTQPAVVRFAAGALKNIGDTYEPPNEDGEKGPVGGTRSDKPLKRSLTRSLTQFPKRSLTRPFLTLGYLSQVSNQPKVLRSPRVETAIKARVQEDQQRHGLEVKAATLIQTRWRGIFAREDASRFADVIREYRCAGAAITNLLRRSPKGVTILQRFASILLIQSTRRRFLAMKLVAKRRVAFEGYRKAERHAPRLISFPGESDMLITIDVRFLRDEPKTAAPARFRIAELSRVRVLTGWE